ncbi:MAG: hypothetical protein JWR38_681 [Mucilaginibacter sp.]|nr:hypothetical protein [Mucilaginibacter sp.]
MNRELMVFYRFKKGWTAGCQITWFGAFLWKPVQHPQCQTLSSLNIS